MKLNLVDDINLVLKKGDACTVESKHTKTGAPLVQLIICCPDCGKVSGSIENHVYNKKTKTYHPSIVHDRSLGGCGWHGWLKQGIFTSC